MLLTLLSWKFLPPTSQSGGGGGGRAANHISSSREFSEFLKKIFKKRPKQAIPELLKDEVREALTALEVPIAENLQPRIAILQKALKSRLDELEEEEEVFIILNLLMS